MTNSNNPLEVATTQPLDLLLQGCKQGNPLSYRALYDQYAKAMYNTCLRIVNNTADAEDILQEAFADAFRNLDTYAYESTFGSWLKRIVVNKAINKVKRDKKRWLELNDSSGQFIQTENEINEEEFEWKIEEIRNAIQQLPDGYRTILCLYLLDNYKHQEIAEMLDISASTVRTQYIRAKTKLLELIKEKL